MCLGGYLGSSDHGTCGFCFVCYIPFVSYMNELILY